jgi:hypothetical protein
MQQVQSFSLLYAQIYIKDTFQSNSKMKSFIKTPNSGVKGYSRPHYGPIQVHGAGPKLFGSSSYRQPLHPLNPVGRHLTLRVFPYDSLNYCHPVYG